jgi:subtilisin family serine protease
MKKILIFGFLGVLLLMLPPFQKVRSQDFAQGSIGLPTFSPAAMKSGVPTAVTVNVAILPQRRSYQVSLMRADSVKSPFLTYLNDDGQDGDGIAGDGVYSGTYNFDGADTSNVLLKVRVQSAYDRLPINFDSSIFNFEVTPKDIPNQEASLNVANIVNYPQLGGRIICNEILVKFASYVSYETIKSVASSVNGTIVGRIPELNTYQLELAGCDPSNLQSKIQFLKSLFFVESASPNSIFEIDNNIFTNKQSWDTFSKKERGPSRSLACPSFFPNDYLYSSQWGLLRINARDAWILLGSTRGAAIGVIDSGVNYTHEDLNGNVILGLDQCGSINGRCIPDSDPRDEQGHGTGVAGIAAALTNNCTGMSGVSFGATIVAEKITYGDTAGISAVLAARGILDAVSKGVKVINLSFNAVDHPQLKAAIDYAIARNRVVVAGIGNNGRSIDQSPVYPASYPGVIAVAASDEQDQRAVWNDCPGGSGSSNFGRRVDIYAPGKNITIPLYNGNTYTTYCAAGTSFATPHVSGVASLILTANPRLKPRDIRFIIKGTADYTNNFDDLNGNEIRVLNLYKAIQKTKEIIEFSNSSYFIKIDVPFNKLPEMYLSYFPTEDPGGFVTQNYNAIDSIGQFQATRQFRSLRTIDDIANIHRNALLPQGWTLVYDTVFVPGLRVLYFSRYGFRFQCEIYDFGNNRQVTNSLSGVVNEGFSY